MTTLNEWSAPQDPSHPFEGFQNLMPYRVQDILLVSSLYDSFTLQEDGRLNELILGEFLELSLHQPPGLTHVATGTEALALARAERRFNLILTTPEHADMDATELALEVKRAGLDVPVVVLAHDYDELKHFVATHDVSPLERIFLWQGDARILVAIVKCIEDHRNVAHDTAIAGVRVVLVVEDNIRYVSSLLPTIYTEIIHQSERLVSEGVNLSHKLVRMRARPKILLTSNYEEAWDFILKYRDQMLGIISDIHFPRGGRPDPEAGFVLARKAREIVWDLPILLHSSHPENAGRARDAGVSFLRKGSPTLLGDLAHFITENFAFGDFIFRLPDGTEVARASDLKSLEEKLRSVPAASVGFHGERNHFSNWFSARTEFALAHKLRPRKVSDFATLEDLRKNIIESIAEYRREQSEVLIRDFGRLTFEPGSAFFYRIGAGSIGGKARGLAFIRYLLSYHRAARRFAGVHLRVPAAVVLATECFDRFLDENDLHDFALSCPDDAELERRFLAAPLPAETTQDLIAFLDAVHWPLAVRSSSLLEDSQHQPFTGVYETFMLPNDHPDLGERLDQLVQSIKRVYASTFSQGAKAYLRATPFRLEEEKMAVILQKVVGARHGPRYYPDFAGVARSRNFYPVPPLTSEDGVAAVALGMGRTVVEGDRCHLFCPRYPRHPMSAGSADDVVRQSQREFFALALDRDQDGERADGAQASTNDGLGHETLYGLDAAEADGTLTALGSTYSAENNAVYDGLSRAGVRLVTFAPILKHHLFPLAEILSHLLDIGSRGMNRPAEMEFAVSLSADPDQPHEFGVVQMRPLVVSRETQELDLGEIRDELLLCKSPRVLGNGKIESLCDLVVIDFHSFDRALSREVADAVERFNAELVAEQRPYLLIGVGRWGSHDPWLGIPVTWDQISGAAVIVESGFRDFRVEPSQGSHFFQNLTSFQIGYFTVNADAGEGLVDWDWIRAQPERKNIGFVRHLRFEQPMVVKMNGKKSQGVIYKPDVATA